MSKFFCLFFGQSGLVYWWRVCYQRGLPRQVSNKNSLMVNSLLSAIFAMRVLTLDTEIESQSHINDKHESLWSDDLSDTKLYEGFDEDVNKI